MPLSQQSWRRKPTTNRSAIKAAGRQHRCKTTRLDKRRNWQHQAAFFEVTPGTTTSKTGKPLISSFEPTTAQSGATVTVVGTNLGPIKSIKIGSIRVLYYKTLSDSRLTIRVPKEARTGKISLVTQRGMATSPKNLVIK